MKRRQLLVRMAQLFGMVVVGRGIAERSNVSLTSVTFHTQGVDFASDGGFLIPEDYVDEITAHLERRPRFGQTIYELSDGRTVTVPMIEGWEEV